METIQDTSNLNSEDKNDFLEEYKLLVNDLHHVHNIQHSLVKYTVPFLVASIGLAYKLQPTIFLFGLVALFVFVIVIWLFYERLDYLIAIKFTRLVELEKYLKYKIYSSVRNPPSDIFQNKKYKLGKKISMIKIYRVGIFCTGIILILMIVFQAFNIFHGSQNVLDGKKTTIDYQKLIIEKENSKKHNDFENEDTLKTIE